jgi:transposase InsO family protein
MDYLGPTTTRRPGESPRKAWILLITCLVTRAIHLEPVWSLAAEDLLHALRQFISRRGRPARILSDNGTQFVMVGKLLTLRLGADAPKWSHIPALSPWQGELYERLVVLVKAAFKTSVGRSTLDPDEFRTFTCEVEAALNSRRLPAK